jgi:caspase domain-containing protein
MRALIALVALALVAGVALAQTVGPKVQLNYPSGDIQTDRDAIPVIGVISDDAGVKALDLTVNGTRVQIAQPDASAPPPSVRLSTRVTLVMNKNVIELTATNAAGQSTKVTRTVTRVPPAVVTAPPPAPKAPPRIVSERYAVVIGAGTYEHKGIPPVRFAEADAKGLYDFLTTKAGFKADNVLLVSDSAETKPTLGGVSQALGSWLVKKVRKEDFALVYFAGRGATEADTSGRSRDGLERYLLTQDTEPDSMFSTGLSWSKVAEIYQRIRCDRVLFLVDADFSGKVEGRSFSRQTTRAVPSAEFLDRLTKSSGHAIITASGPNESAREMLEVKHGLFTHYVLQGLEGAADTDKDGVVTLSELYVYVQSKVAEHAKRLGTRQSPVLDGNLTDVPLAELAQR